MSDIIQFPRASARPSANRTRHGTPSQPTAYYAEGLPSGMSPVAVPGGSRRPRSAARASISTLEVEAHFAATAGMMFVAGCLTVALLTLVLL
jgi:hypothetical protein